MKLTVSLAQMDVKRAAPAENLEKGATWIEEASRRGSDLICFPEMWTSGFDWAYLARAAKEHVASAERLSALAREYGIWINGTIPMPVGDRRVTNTSIFFNPQGERAAVYSKCHLFSFMHEDRYLAPGNEMVEVETPWGLTGLTVCYDIRFPELFRSYAIRGVQLVLSPMAFPYPRIAHWKTLVRARAIENQMYVIGVNQVGDEDFGADGKVTYFGDSCVIDPWGETVVEASEKNEELLTVTFDMDLVRQIREKMTVLGDRRPDVYGL